MCGRGRLAAKKCEAKLLAALSDQAKMSLPSALTAIHSQRQTNRSFVIKLTDKKVQNELVIIREVSKTEYRKLGPG